MSVPSPRDGLSLDQAPPLAIPASFFLLAPLAVVVAGAVLLILGGAALGSGGRPGSLALAHLAALGFLGSVMLGALYQMAPVVAGAPVPAIRLAHGVHALWAVGVGSLVTGFLGGGRAWFDAAALGLGLALVGFLGPVLWGLLRSGVGTWTARGMTVAVLGLGIVGTLGLLFASLHGGHTWAADLPGFDLSRWRLLHFGLGLGVWVGGLLAAVSWQILPMFYLAPPVPKGAQAAVALGAAASLVLGPTALLLGGSRGAVVGALLPAFVAAWIVHPAWTLPRLRARQRKRRDETVTAWTASLLCAPLAALLGAAAWGLDDPRWGVAWIWVAFLGWAGFAVHGMLCRIVPFLQWFHRLSPLVGKRPVPSVRALMPQDRIRLALRLHGGSLVLGLLALASGSDLLARAAGLLLIGTGLALGRNLVQVLRFSPG